MHAHFLKLIAAQQIDMVVIDPQEKSDVAFPAIGVFPIQHGDTARLRSVDRLPPIKPGSRARGPGARNAGLRETPVNER